MLLAPATPDQAGASVPNGAAIWLVRHAQPLVASGVCYGALDVPADADATHQAALVLADVLPKRVQIITSPLQRCEQLALVLCGLRADLIRKTDTRLAEMNFGCWEGQRWDQIPQSAYDCWMRDFWQHRFGGVESVAGFMARVSQVWAEAKTTSNLGVPQLWVTHAGVIRAVNLLAQGVREVHDAALWPADAPAFGQWWLATRPQERL
jgi:alpha-ribazole phosphatase